MQTKSNGKPATKDPLYIPFMNNVTSIRNACTIAMTDLYAADRADLSAPFARILEVLASVDTAALKALDAKHEPGT